MADDPRKPMTGEKPTEPMGNGRRLFRDVHHEQCPWAKADRNRLRSACGCPPGWPKSVREDPDDDPDIPA